MIIVHSNRSNECVNMAVVVFPVEQKLWDSFSKITEETAKQTDSLHVGNKPFGNYIKNRRANPLLTMGSGIEGS